MKTCPNCDTNYPNQQTHCPVDGIRLVESDELEPGTLVCSKYRIERVVGEGGMGKVYLAQHVLLGQPRALKFMARRLGKDVKSIKRFRLEAMAAIKLRHPNIVEVGDLDQAEDGSPFIAMEYVEGCDLQQALVEAPFPVERALSIARGVGLGLIAAHSKGILHRDIKPLNVRLAQEPGIPETPKILDFGIAAMKESSAGVSRTRGIMLTPEYAAPEQWSLMAAEQLDGRVDLYALGGVLYEMLTGQTCLYAQDEEGWMDQHLHVAPKPPSKVRPELARWKGLDQLVLRLLEKDRERRTSSAEEFVRELDRVRLGEDEPERSGRWLAWTVAVLALVVVLSAGGFLWWQRQQAVAVPIERKDRPAPIISDSPSKTTPNTGTQTPSFAGEGSQEPKPVTHSPTVTPQPVTPQPAAPQSAMLTVSCDMACNWSLNGMPRGKLEAGQFQTVAAGRSGNATVEAEAANERMTAQQKTLTLRAGARQDAIFFFTTELQGLRARIKGLVDTANARQHDGDDAGAVAALNEALQASPDSAVTAQLQQKKDQLMAECKNLGISCN